MTNERSEINKQFGRDLLDFIYNHEYFEKIPLEIMAKEFGIVSAMVLGIGLRDERWLSNEYLERIKNQLIYAFILNFDNQIAKGKGK